MRCIYKKKCVYIYMYMNIYVDIYCIHIYIYYTVNIAPKKIEP